VEDPGVDERIILKLFLNEKSGKIWTGLVWVRIGAHGEIL
jgi:hypothetical protein